MNLEGRTSAGGGGQAWSKNGDKCRMGGDWQNFCRMGGYSQNYFVKIDG